MAIQPSIAAEKAVLQAGTQPLFEIHGSNTIGAELAPALVKSYLQDQGGETPDIESTTVENERFVVALAGDGKARIKVAAHGSSTGFKALEADQADVWASSRPAKDKEVSKFAARADLTSMVAEHVIAIDGLAIIVHPNNPLKQLTKQQLNGIFSGEIADWKDVGGRSGPIHLYARDNNSGTFDTFNSLVLGKKKLRGDAKRYESNAELSSDVYQDKQGIGFTGYAFVGSNKALAIADGDSPAILPTRLSIATEDYPLSRRLFFYTPGKSANDWVNQFIEFSLSQSGQKIVGDIGFVEQNIIAVEAELDNTVPQSFKRLTKNYRRLSVNFRFAEGRTRLDNKALRDIQRVMQYLEQQQLEPRHLLLIGFADQQSNEFRAQQISELRAHSVHRAFRDKGIEVKAYTGYGQYMPVAQAGGKSGASRNGRVEVWIRKTEQNLAMISQ